MRNRQRFPLGMTLVELLVVVAIMVLLLAVSVPMLRPVLETQKTANAARVLEKTFQQARMKSIQERQSYAVRLIPFGNAPTTSVEMRLQKGGLANYVNPPNIRVRVENGTIVPYFFDDEWNKTNWNANDLPNVQLQQELETAQKHFEEEGSVQFNRIGRSFDYTVNDSGIPSLSEPYENLELPEDLSLNDALEYRVTRLADVKLDWMPPIVMPRGTIVDLAFSGGESYFFGGEDKEPGDLPSAFLPGDDVVVIFSPAGHVDWLYVSGKFWKVNEMLYFCVGDWVRQVDIDGVSLAEDKKTNLEASATYWVTLHPKTGGVRMAENTPITSSSDTPEKKLRDARKFASEHFFNVGGN